MALDNIITEAEARSYAHDNEASQADMLSWIAAATAYIENGVSPHVDISDPQVKLLCKLLVCDFDDTRALSGSEANSTRFLIRSIVQQLKMKYRDAPAVSDSDTEEEAADES